MTLDPVSPPARRDAPFYVLAAVAGIGTGWADVAVNDLLFTALLVLMACMLLGLLRPRWPWRWVVVVGIFIPLSELAAYLVFTVKPTRAPGLWIISGMAAGHCGRLRRIADARRFG